VSGNVTPDTPDLSETGLREMKVDELRERASEEGIGGTSSLRKDELVDAISEHRREASGDATSGDGEDSGEPDQAGQPGDAGPEGGHLRTGPETSKSLKYSQEITSPDEDPERPGRSLATTSHEVIRQWAEARNAVPATVEGTEHGDHLGVLRFDFGGDDEGRLRHVSWEEWFDTFDERSLNFIYQEERKDGQQSNFFRLESPQREDA
jgi:Rho termination factor, N-terminal domain